MTNHLLDTKSNKEKVLLVAVYFKNNRTDWTAAMVLEEMEELITACRGEVVESVICPLEKATAGHLIGEGKVKDIANLCAAKNIDLVVFSHDLKGSQQRNLEEAFQVRTIDRTQVILDIFARNASTMEGKMQVELAQLEYLLPRLVGKGIELSQLGGGIGTSGPGETKLEIDRRRIAERITRLSRDLKEVAQDRELKRKKRKEKGVPTISLVGYTNAGKSTLLNCLTLANQPTKDGLFTTLDSLSRQFLLPNHQKVILSDTVGFMHDLPHNLIEAFKATLEEVKQADLLLHVLDISNSNYKNLYDSVGVVLNELEANQKPTLMVLNKIDKLEEKDTLDRMLHSFDNAVAISAKTGENIEKLHEKIQEMLSSLIIEIDVMVPMNRMDLVTLAHQEGQVIAIKYYNDKINIRAVVPAHLAGKFQK